MQRGADMTTGRMTTPLRIGVATAVVLLSMNVARSQDAATHPPVDPRSATPPEDAHVLIDKLVDQKNGGVGGTGLGKLSTAQQSGVGTGMSVKGPPGQGDDLTMAKPSP